MHFLLYVYVPCEVCKGKRYNRETLEVSKYKGKNIHDVLSMTVEEGLEFLKIYQNTSQIANTSLMLAATYKIGRPSTTLSGGEAQRVKLSTELSRRGTGKTLYDLTSPLPTCILPMYIVLLMYCKN